MLLGLLGGAVGLFVARLSLSIVRTMNPGNVPRLEDIGINGAVLAFTFGLSLATGILFGLAPAWRAIKVDLNAESRRPQWMASHAPRSDYAGRCQ
jgi:ABC-type antimicrobial peptide transport system permease subunit